MSRDVEILADPADEPGLVDEWRALAEAAGNAFTTPEWYGAYARHYGADAPPFVVRVRDADGSLAGLLPLCRSGRTVRFAGANVGDRFAPVAVAGREAEVARAAAGALGREARRAAQRRRRRPVDRRAGRGPARAGARPPGCGAASCPSSR